MTLAAILSHKKRQFGDLPVAQVAPTVAIADVARLLTRRRIGAVLVMDAADQLLGIVSERDIVRAVAQDGAAALEKTAAQLMTSKVRTAAPSMTVAQAMETMSEGRFRHLPVVDQGRLIGIVSIGDVVTARLRDAAQEVDTLKAYVAGQA
jgi:CBS domain-containing protein